MATVCLVAALLGFVALPAMHLLQHGIANHTHRHEIDGSTRHISTRWLAHAHDGSAHRHALALHHSRPLRRRAAGDRAAEAPKRPTLPDDHGDGGLAHLAATLLAAAAPTLPLPLERATLARPRARASLLAQRRPERDGAPRAPPTRLT